MANLWYISPSDQTRNIGVGNYGSEEEQMNLLADAIMPHLDRCGVQFHQADRNLPITDRPQEANEMGARYYLALHSNAGGNGAAWGPIAFYHTGGKALAERLAAELLALGQQTNRSSHVVQNTALFELVRPSGNACLLEVDFHDSTIGSQFILTRREEIAQAIAKAIVAIDGKQWVAPSILEDIPAYARPTVRKLLDRGALQGKQNGQLDLSEDMLRLLVIHDRMGLYDL